MRDSLADSMVNVGAKLIAENQKLKGRAMKYLIWSFEHGGWWGPGHIGYYPKRADAGIYSEQDAMDIVTLANIITINEALVPITHALGEDIIAGGKLTAPDELPQ